ncbi:MAG TPA: PilZ domain-containing protein, partial [Vicinamibacterales bacterium]|nr:PilZ domain-containing protein [Vicinamibacterales bacterium]
AGHRARGAAGAVELLADLTGTGPPPDLLLLDLRLTSAPAADLLQAIRDAAPGLPVVLFSGSVTGAAEVRALVGFGISGYVNEHTASRQILPALAPHLFPDSFNRRGSPRVAFGAPVACHAGDTIVAAVAFDLSRGGLGVRTTVPLDTGTEVRLRFRLPGGAADLDAGARVAWSDHRTGMGLQFTGLDAAARRAIDDFVDAHAAAPRG